MSQVRIRNASHEQEMGALQEVRRTCRARENVRYKSGSRSSAQYAERGSLTHPRTESMKNQKTEANKRKRQRGLRPATCSDAPDSTHPKCEACDGTGQTANDEPGLSGPPITCPDCLGTGSMAAMQKEKNRRVAEHYSTRRPAAEGSDMLVA